MSDPKMPEGWRASSNVDNGGWDRYWLRVDALTRAWLKKPKYQLMGQDKTQIKVQEYLERRFQNGKGYPA